MAAELESVVHRLDAQTKLLKQRVDASRGDDDKEMMLKSLALVSEVLLKVSRDVRHLRNNVVDPSGV